MIHSLRLQNFKGIRDVEVGLERLTVFVGPNGSGKTSFLEGLSYLSRLGSENTAALFGNQFSPLLAYNCNAWPEPMEATCSADWGDLYWSASPTANPTREQSKFSIKDWDFQFLAKLAGTAELDWKQFFGDIDFTNKLEPTGVLKLNPSVMANPSSGAYRKIKLDGRGLASVLAFMQGNQPDVFLSVTQRLKQIIPTIDRIRFDRIELPLNTHHKAVKKSVKGEEQAIFKWLPEKFDDEPTNQLFAESILFDFLSAKDVPARLVSEGTLLALGLVSILINKDGPDLVLLDDLDRGLHPLAQRELITAIRAIMIDNPNLQVIATTHSPFMVDSLQPEEVRMTTLNDDGTVACGRLVDHPKFERWKDEMAPGEMWSMFGEKWVSQKPQTAQPL